MPVPSAPSNRLTLYDIGLEGLVISDILTENEGELTPELEARIDELMRRAPDRVESAAMVVKQLDAYAQTCKQEATRLAERAASFTKNADRLKKLMVVAVDAAFNGKVKTARFSIWTQKAADSVSFDVGEGFTLEMVKQDHPDLVRTKEEISLNKIALEQIYKSGQPIPEAISATPKTGERYIRIK